jgi:transcriptional regulator with PAS, ATPase and Fis domain
MENWSKEFPSAITVCDAEGIIVYMNDKASKTFEKSGGKNLIGANVFNCHPEPAKSQLIEMIKNQTSNHYTIEKNGIKKIIHQSPWFVEEEYKGFVEISIEIPFNMAHFVRKSD